MDTLGIYTWKIPSIAKLSNKRAPDALEKYNTVMKILNYFSTFKMPHGNLHYIYRLIKTSSIAGLG
jgi:hypothetical protein